jgi:hypothetical protein
MSLLTGLSFGMTLYFMSGTFLIIALAGFLSVIGIEGDENPKTTREMVVWTIGFSCLVASVLGVIAVPIGWLLTIPSALSGELTQPMALYFFGGLMVAGTFLLSLLLALSNRWAWIVYGFGGYINFEPITNPLYVVGCSLMVAGCGWTWYDLIR